ncbi:MAG: hypothetical protein ABI361_13410 [Nitrososphaera sp.]|jgi:hypothetical protein
MIDALVILAGVSAGLAATAAMTLIEIYFWKRWGIAGVFEWHENQVLAYRFFRLDPNRLHFAGIFFLHFANGGLGGLALLISIAFIPQLLSIPILILGVLYGLFLWTLTLAPIHKPITGLHPWKHPLGKGPALASIGGHAVYGLVLGIILLIAVH